MAKVQKLNGSTPLRDVSGGDFVIVNEELHGKFDEFRSKVAKCMHM